MHTPSLIAYLILGLSLIVHPAPTSTTVNDISGQLDNLDISKTHDGPDTKLTGNPPVPDWAVENGKSRVVKWGGIDVYGPSLTFTHEDPDPYGPFTAIEARVSDEVMKLVEKVSSKLISPFPESAPVLFLSRYPWPQPNPDKYVPLPVSPTPQFTIQYYGYPKNSNSLVPASGSIVKTMDHLYGTRRVTILNSVSGSGIRKRAPRSKPEPRFKPGPRFRMDQMDLSSFLLFELPQRWTAIDSTLHQWMCLLVDFSGQSFLQLDPSVYTEAQSLNINAGPTSISTCTDALIFTITRQQSNYLQGNYHVFRTAKNPPDAAATHELDAINPQGIEVSFLLGPPTNKTAGRCFHLEPFASAITIQLLLDEDHNEMHTPSLIAYLILGLSLIVNAAPTPTTAEDIGASHLPDFNISITYDDPDKKCTGKFDKPFSNSTVEIDRSRFGSVDLDPGGPFTAAEAGVPSRVGTLIKEKSLELKFLFPEPAPFQFISQWPWPHFSDSRVRSRSVRVPISSQEPQFNVQYYGYNYSRLLVPASAGYTYVLE
ncbi:hypothetical protein EV360DRAFT_70898 [Lentinula raphanica]|nr:hypothetical protein EV360DRAFT_70898 [Lentinula raphanica]